MNTRSCSEKAARRLGAILTAAALAAGLIGCASEFAQDPLKPRPTRAVRPPGDRGDAFAEATRDENSGGGVNILTVSIPNKRNESPEISTIFDPAVNSASAGAAPAATQASTQPVHKTAPESTPSPGSVAGAQQVRIVALQKPTDGAAVAADNQGNIVLTITSPSGIGSLIMERTGDYWPAVMHVVLRYGDRPFATLEGFTASEVLAEDRHVELKSTVDKPAGKADITIPGFTRSQRIKIEWIDAYR